MKKSKKFIWNQKYDLTLYLLSLSILMLGLSYISVPLYQIFCQTYGLGGIIQKNNLELDQFENNVSTNIDYPGFFFFFKTR
jgi:cytochrome c oxidase assembly protein Cox11